MKGMRASWRPIAIYFIMLVAMIVTVSLKQNYHVDEMLSYILSNNETGYMHFTDGHTYTPAVSLFKEQYSVQSGSFYNYQTVWQNQANDVHPPLYYIFLHTICSLFGGVSMWQPAIINIIFGLLSLWMLRKLLRLFATSRQLEDSRYCGLLDMISVIYAILPGILCNISFFRMYVVAMFMVTWVSYIILRIVQCAVTDKSISKKLWMGLFFATVLSAMTHYYCVLYLILIEVVLFVVLIIYKKYKCLL